ncbi:cytochrome c3 family protein [Pelovirga terrestris]|uniref:Cytochrome c3 family protein n=1 Tax=Pelovirga terrestris TaxID=2771352 RepID=A0A8J6QUS4_9BACT|nr:cytochrome c3 family protein [Pelovirga terrestris]MBD1400685.1 cytochrome c3 family protein [Pelovirga terrestris]
MSRTIRSIFVVVIISVVLIAAWVLSSQDGHRFAPDDCLICHTSAQGGRNNLRPDVTESCATCHPSQRDYQAHPTDIIPKKHLPGDMLLVDGRFTCVSCHDVHQGKSKSGRRAAYYLRRNVAGKPFCLICHDVDDKGHMLIGTTHVGQFEVQDRGIRMDATTLLCIECHMDRIASIDADLGAGNWNHFSGRLNHPIGSSYQEAYRERPMAYTPPEFLPEEVKLFDGKIGCGTCHNRYSGIQHMLVISNYRSALCLSCHNK